MRGEIMDVSVVCPFFNESGILEHAIRTLLARLRTLNARWELIVVNDGSTDGSGAIAERIASEAPQLRVLGYRYNRGRGHALRTGIAAARGEIIITTEIDLSWGEEIVHDLLAEIEAHPETDIVVASPHLPGGGYKNVPAKRVWLSRIGNHVIRACMSNATTMNTGMTRAYRRNVIQSLPLFADGKEFHLEVILKATEFGLHIREIPALLEWKEYKHQGKRVKRTSSSRVNRLIVSHSLFSVFANPVRYVWAASLFTAALGAGFFIYALILYSLRMVSAYTALFSLALFIVAIVLFVLGVVVKQGNMIQRELWTIERFQLALEKRMSRGEQEDAPVVERVLRAVK
jgi:glycosyltransferase involved in cell wall biosynthesis